MRFSKYNYICELPNTDHFLLYNFLTNALVKLDYDTKQRITDINKLTENELSLLKENGFIIDNFDEIDYLKFGNKLVCTDSELLSILIAPTMACNFRCPYCFEHHGSGLMTPQIQNEIISFIENKLGEKKHKHLFVYWFGGEPLLGIEIIEQMSRRIIELADKFGVGYSSAISTNGYYLTEENLAILEKCKLNRIQITLDGMREMNDKTRVLANGEGTFDVIVSNLRKAKTNITIHIRTNLTKANKDEIGKLSTLVTEIQKETGSNISIYGAHMSVYDYNNENVDALELSIQEYSDTLKNNNMMGLNKRSTCRFAFCDAARIHSYCFDEKGNLYKCWNDIGNPIFSYGNVIDANHCGVSLLSDNALSFLSKSFPDECVDCIVLPICMGGCIKKRVVEKRKSCSPVKYNLNDYVYKKYAEQMGGENYDFGN